MKSCHARYRIAPGRPFRLSTVDLEETSGPEKARKRFKSGLRRLCALQERLYAETGQSLLVILPAMDSGGKDSTIERVLSGITLKDATAPHSRSRESPEELALDFLLTHPPANPYERVHRRVGHALLGMGVVCAIYASLHSSPPPAGSRARC